MGLDLPVNGSSETMHDEGFKVDYLTQSKYDKSIHQSHGNNSFLTGEIQSNGTD